MLSVQFQISCSQPHTWPRLSPLPLSTQVVETLWLVLTTVTKHIQYWRTRSRGIKFQSQILCLLTQHDNLQWWHDWTGHVKNRLRFFPLSALWNSVSKPTQLIPSDVAFSLLETHTKQKNGAVISPYIYICTYTPTCTCIHIYERQKLKPSFATLSTFWSARTTTNLKGQASNWFLEICADQIAHRPPAASFSPTWPHVSTYVYEIRSVHCNTPVIRPQLLYCCKSLTVTSEVTSFVWNEDISAQKNDRECVVCTPNSGAAATVSWRFHGTHEDEKMIWLGFLRTPQPGHISHFQYCQECVLYDELCIKMRIMLGLKQKKREKIMTSQVNSYCL